jgi:hypothetical protein
VQLHPVRACGAANVLESLVHVEPVTLGEHALGLLDRDTRPQSLLELGAPLVRGLGDGQESADRGGGLDGPPCSKGVDRMLGGVLVHSGVLFDLERPFWATLIRDRGRSASRGVSRADLLGSRRGWKCQENQNVRCVLRRTSSFFAQ